ncbi:DUF1800 domain-containing protein [Ideonella sp.]|uniref:DUF1800 domain-containing protein n=1 Tax=Ideonella sp. TaxID=1929293 RepID=UPI002B49887C|nr:DUF1800 domain-containing protein [Ideonella sp.]HJV69117.1 DUF1800 domain-containing protein [Ideonella sp.]
MTTDPLKAAIAAHRFGLGEPSLAAVGADPAAWLRGQIGPADPPAGGPFPTAAQALAAYAEQKVPLKGLLDIPGKTPMASSPEFELRKIIGADLQSRLTTAVTTRRPFAERLMLFWANHFSVSINKGTVRGLAGALEREAIRPNIAGKFETLLRQASLHPAMLRYLDNNASTGPHSRAALRVVRKGADDERRKKLSTGLNENLAREIMELHSLGVAGGGGAYGPWGGYTQADVTAFAAVLTGWRAYDPPRDDQAVRFEANWHEPGDKTIMGKRYPEGAQALDLVIHDLAHHPSTARFVSTKLARHFVADEPPRSLVDKLADTFTQSGGDLAAVYRTLIDAPESWDGGLAKLKTPEEFAISSLRVLGTDDRQLAKGKDSALGSLGQRPHTAPSPAGWPDKADEWLGPDAIWKRVEWALRLAERVGDRIDARALARASLGPRLSEATYQQIERAADGTQALVLLLMSPEFQRR